MFVYLILCTLSWRRISIFLYWLFVCCFFFIFIYKEEALLILVHSSFSSRTLYSTIVESKIKKIYLKKNFNKLSIQFKEFFNSSFILFETELNWRTLYKMTAMLCDKNIKRKNDRFLYGKRNKEFVILKAKKKKLHWLEKLPT